MRAIVVASKSIQPNIPSDGKNILVTGYMPYSEVLNGAKLLIHSGGIGAIGWALKFGLPSVVVPTVWDQFDNAELIEKNRIGCVEWASASNEWELSRLIRFALMNDEIKSNVIRFKDLISEENGGVAAANKIISFVEGGGGNSCLLQSR